MGKWYRGIRRRLAAHFTDVGKELTANAQAGVDLEAAIQMRIVEQTFPANDGARFFEVDAHDDLEIGSVFVWRVA